MERIYHHYSNLEEHKHGLWKTITGNERERLLLQAIDFTANTKLYGEWMMRVIKEMPKSCEHNLSDTSLNRQAWIGHAACCLAIKCPEDITREAWHCLTKEQQDLANLEADKAIQQWEKNVCLKDSSQLTFW